MLAVGYKVCKCHVHFMFTLHGIRVFRLKDDNFRQVWGGHEGSHMSRDIKN